MRLEGLEPPLLAELEPKSSVSTNFTTGAFLLTLQIGQKFPSGNSNPHSGHFSVISFPLKWCRRRDSNSRPTAYKAVALPTELRRLFNYQLIIYPENVMCQPVLERHTGFEPVTRAWKARMLPLHQCRIIIFLLILLLC